MDTTNLNLLWASLLVEELARHDINYYCFSSGGRVAPLAVAIGRSSTAKALVSFDERAAAFHALGYARATGRPAVLACTSGSAASHYFPAIIEAARDELPMLILTADLPPEMRDSGANQAIRQNGIYGDYVRWAFDFPCSDARIPAAVVLSTVDEAVHRSRHPLPGPVHLNIPFREPLSPVPANDVSAEYLAPLRHWLERTEPYKRSFAVSTCGLNESGLQALDAAVAAAERGLLVLGRLHSRAESEAALALANRLRWPVFADVLSGLRLDARLATLISHSDQLLLAKRFAAACLPDTVLQIGGHSVSPNLPRHLAAQPPRAYIQLSSGYQRQDPNHQVSLRLQGNLEVLCRHLAERLPAGQETEWLRSLRALSGQAEALYASELDVQESLSEPALARLLTRLMPGDEVLMVGNSMPVREVDGFAEPGPQPLWVVGNRGVSGIDGTVATAAGYAVGSGRPVTLLCGDLTLFHDLSSLYLLRQIEPPVTVVVINNGGGGSFSFLPISKHQDVFEKYFATPHALSFKAAAALFGLDYHAPATRSDLVQAYQACRQGGRPALVEVFTERSATLACQRHLQQELALRLAEKTPYPEPASMQTRFVTGTGKGKAV